MKKFKFIYGLFGCSSDGILYMPSGRKIIKLSKNIAFKIHTFLNDYISYGGMKHEIPVFIRSRSIK